MRIDPKSNIGSIRESNMKKNTTVAGDSQKDTEKYHTDRVEISNTVSIQDELGFVKEKVVTDVEKPADPDRLRELKAAIKNGTYAVSSADIADAILNPGRKVNQGVEE